MSAPAPTASAVPAARQGLFARLDDAVYEIEKVLTALSMGVMVLVVFIDVVHRRLTASDSRLAHLLSFGNRGLEAKLTGPVVYGLLLAALFGLVRFAIVTLRRHEVGAGPSSRPRPALVAIGVTALVAGALWLMLRVESRVFLGGLTLLLGLALGASRRNAPGLPRTALLLGAAVAALEWLIWKYIPTGYSWSKEVSMILLVWNGMLGASMCSHDGKHIEFDFGPKALPAGLRPLFVAAGSLVQLFFTVFLTVVSAVYVFGGRGLLALGGVFEQSGVPDWTVGLVCPVVFCIISARTGERMLRQLGPLGWAGLGRSVAIVAAVVGVIALGVWGAFRLSHGHVEEASSLGGWGWLPFSLVLVLLILLGEPLYVIMGGVVVACFLLWSDSVQRFSDFTILIERIRSLADTQAILSVPFFILSGNLMATGKLSGRLIDFAKAAVGWLPGGLALAAIMSCVIFASIIGSSPATLAAIGSVMVPALVKDRYREDFSIGLVTTVGSLGILIPPSIPMIIFCIFFTATPIEVERLFLAGVGPGLFVALIVGIYSSFVASREGIPRQKFDATALRLRFVDGFWALMLPVVILGGIYTGLFNAIEASAVACAYALVAEVYFERGMRWRDVPKVIAETSVLMGSFIVVIVMAMAMGEFLETAGIPQATAEWITAQHMTQSQFLLALVLLLLVVGCLMDIMSAIMVFAPLTGPVALQLGVDPVHLGIIFIITLEVGYVTPPVGLNLFLSCTMFDKSFGYLIKATAPFVVVMTVCVFGVTYIPALSIGPVRWIYGATQRGGEQVLPAAEREHRDDRPAARHEGDEARPPEKKQGVQSIEEMMREQQRTRDGGP